MSRVLWRLIAVGSTLGVVVMCFLPGESVPKEEIFKADKLIHALAFFVVAFAWLRSGLSLRVTLLVCLLLAAGTEIGQSLIGDGRKGDWLDFLADALGTILGAHAARIGTRAKSAPR